MEIYGNTKRKIMDVLNSQNKIIIERANAAVLSRDYTLAARLYKGLLKSEPQNIGFLMNLGDLYVKSGNDSQALPYYKDIISIDPSNVAALNSMGAIYRRQKKYDDSIAVLEQAVIHDEENPQIYYNLGFTYKLMGKYSDAIQCFNTVVEKNPSDVLAWNHLGSIYAAQNSNDNAVNAYLKGLKIDPNHPVLHLNLAESYEKLGRDELAVKEYEAALRSKPGWLDAIEGYADLLLKMNKTRSACETVQKGIHLNPQDTLMHIKMGQVYSKQSDFENAEKEYQSALEIESRNTQALSGLADSQENLGKYEDAEITMNRWEQEDPLSPDMLRQYAGVLLSENKLFEASEKIKRVYDENPNDVHSLNLLGQYYICRGDENKAMGCFKKIRKIDPSYMDFYKGGGKRFIQKGKYSRAQEFFEKYMEKNPKDLSALTSLAHSYELEGNYDDAQKFYNKIGEIDSDNFAYKTGTERMNAFKYKPNAFSKNSDLDEIDNADDNISFDEFDIGKSKEDEENSLDAIAEEEGFDISSDLLDDEKDDSLQIPETANLNDTESPAEEKMNLDGFSDLADSKDGVSIDEVFEEGKLDDEIEADCQEKYNENLENLVSDEDDKKDDFDDEEFFKGNPFGTAKQNSHVPEKDDYDTMFSSEEIADEKNNSDDGFELEEITEDDSDEKNENLQKAENPKNESSDLNEKKLPDEKTEELSKPQDLKAYDENNSDEKIPAKKEIEPLENPQSEDDKMIDELFDTGKNGDNQNKNSFAENSPKNPGQIKNDDGDIKKENSLSNLENQFEAESPKLEEEKTGEEKKSSQMKSDDDILEKEISPADLENQFEKENSNFEGENFPDFEENFDDENSDFETDENENAENYSLSETVPEMPEIADAKEAFLQSKENSDFGGNEILDGEEKLSGDDEILGGEEKSFGDDEISDGEEKFAGDDEILDGEEKSEVEAAAELFKKLKVLSEYLPEGKKQEFLESHTRLELEYLISRLSGSRGLLETAQKIRENLNIKNSETVSEDGIALVKNVLVNSSKLSRNLTDRELAAALNYEIEKLYEKL